MEESIVAKPRRAPGRSKKLADEISERQLAKLNLEIEQLKDKNTPPPSSESEAINKTISERQLEKLTLEIEQLKNRSKWHDRITPYVSSFTVLITVAGLVFGIYQFQKQQEKLSDQTATEQQRYYYSQLKERANETQKGLESNLEKLVTFPKDEKMSVAMATLSLTFLSNYVNEKAKIQTGDTEPTEEQIAETVKQLNREISGMLAEVIQNDCNFENAREVGFANSVLINWSDYREYLKENPKVNYVILDHFKNTLQKIHDKDSSVVRKVTYDDKTETFLYKNGYGELGSDLSDHFHDILLYYLTAYKFIEDEGKRVEMATAFQSATCNKTLTQQLLGTSFETKGNDFFRGCPAK